MARVRIAVLALKPDLDRDAGEVGGPEGQSRLGVALLDRQHLRLAEVEVDVHRIGLHDGRELRRPADAHERAHVHEMMGDDPVEGRRHVRVAEIDVGELDGGLGAEDRGVRLVDVGLPLLNGGLGREVLPAERRLPVVFGLVVGLLGFGVGERRLRLVELRLVLVALDAEELRSLGDDRPVLVVDRVQIALHARDEIDRIEGGGVAGELKVERGRLLDRLRHDDFRRRRRNVGVLGVAGRKGERSRDERQGRRDATRPDGRGKGFNHPGVALSQKTCFGRTSHPVGRRNAGDACSTYASGPRVPSAPGSGPDFEVENRTGLWRERRGEADRAPGGLRAGRGRGYESGVSRRSDPPSMTQSPSWAPPAPVSLPVQGQSQRAPVNRIFCVGRNYAAHAAEMGHQAARKAAATGRSTSSSRRRRWPNRARRSPTRPRRRISTTRWSSSSLSARRAFASRRAARTSSSTATPAGST